MPLESYALLRQQAGAGFVAAAFMHAVFVVDLHCGNVMCLAEARQYLRCFAPGVGLGDQQRHIELVQLLLQVRQVTQPEIHLGRRVMVGLPLAWAEQKQRHGRAGSHGRGEGAVVVHAQVGAKPHQLAHAGSRVRA